MKKGPELYVVVEEFHDYGLRGYSLEAWFFDSREAHDWAEQKQKETGKHYVVEEVGPGDSETIEKERW